MIDKMTLINTNDPSSFQSQTVQPSKTFEHNIQSVRITSAPIIRMQIRLYTIEVP